MDQRRSRRYGACHNIFNNHYLVTHLKLSFAPRDDKLEGFPPNRPPQAICPQVTIRRLSARMRSVAFVNLARGSDPFFKAEASASTTASPCVTSRADARMMSIPALLAKRPRPAASPKAFKAPASSASVIVTPPKPSRPRSSPSTHALLSPAGYVASSEGYTAQEVITMSTPAEIALMYGASSTARSSCRVRCHYNVQRCMVRSCPRARYSEEVCPTTHAKCVHLRIRFAIRNFDRPKTDAE